MNPTNFYLGTHQANWVWSGVCDFRLFISMSRLVRYKNLKPATTRWAMDSGGFTQVTKFGRWKVREWEYIEFVQRVNEEIGNLDFVAPMDWMCETPALKATGLTVKAHQRLTVDNFIRLRHALGNLVIPVLQGDTVQSYLEHVEMYKAEGIDLTLERLVGLGSVCRRQSTSEIVTLAGILWMLGVRLHGFGVKSRGLQLASQFFETSDSLAWSTDGRWSQPLPGCTHKNCANCLKFAKRWRRKVINILVEKQLREFGLAA